MSFESVYGGQNILDSVHQLPDEPPNLIDNTYTKLYGTDVGSAGNDIWARHSWNNAFGLCKLSASCMSCSFETFATAQHRCDAQVYLHPNGLCVLGAVATHAALTSSPSQQEHSTLANGARDLVVEYQQVVLSPFRLA